MSFDLKKPTWKIFIWRGGCEPYSYWFSGTKREAMKEAVATFNGIKGKNERKKGSLYRDGFAEWVHPAFGSGAEVRIERWN